MELPPDWNEFIASLCSHEVRFLIVGAHAVAAHGRPRATQDLDIWTDPAGDNPRRICAALADFGFTALAAEVEAFGQLDRMATLGHPPLRIDIMTSVTGVAFDVAWAHRVMLQFGRFEVPFIGREELLANKRASGRPKDLADIALLTEGRDDG